MGEVERSIGRGLTPDEARELARGGLPGHSHRFACVILAGEAVGDAERKDPAHDEIGWFGPDDLPEQTWDRELIAARLRDGAGVRL
jgi:hypothetical protein